MGTVTIFRDHFKSGNILYLTCDAGPPRAPGTIEWDKFCIKWDQGENGHFLAVISAQNTIQSQDIVIIYNVFVRSGSVLEVAWPSEMLKAPLKW